MKKENVVKASSFLKWFLIISRFCFVLALVFNLISIFTYVVQAVEHAGTGEYISKVFYTSLLAVQSAILIFISSCFIKVIRYWLDRENLVESLRKGSRGLVYLVLLQGLILVAGTALNISYQKASSGYLSSTHWSVPFIDFVQSQASVFSIVLNFFDPTPVGALALMCALFIFLIEDRLEKTKLK